MLVNKLKVNEVIKVLLVLCNANTKLLNYSCNVMSSFAQDIVLVHTQKMVVNDFILYRDFFEKLSPLLCISTSHHSAVLGHHKNLS